MLYITKPLFYYLSKRNNTNYQYQNSFVKT